MIGDVESAVGRCGSLAEVRFLMGLVSFWEPCGWDKDLKHLRLSGDDCALVPGALTHATLSPQVVIRDYRIDFILCGFWRLDEVAFATPIAIEIDDPRHQKEPTLTTDRVRDRVLARKGYSVARFTNHEVFADSAGCGRWAIEALADLGRHRGIDMLDEMSLVRPIDLQGELASAGVFRPRVAVA